MKLMQRKEEIKRKRKWDKRENSLESQPRISDSRQQSQWPTNLKSRRKNRSKKLNSLLI